MFFFFFLVEVCSDFSGDGGGGCLSMVGSSCGVGNVEGLLVAMNARRNEGSRRCLWCW